jgi:hypothetical protein
MMKENEPIFYPEEKDREKAERIVIQNLSIIMRKAGISEKFIYAFQKTGTLVTTEGRSWRSPEDLEEWDAAVIEYEKLEQSRNNSVK